MRLEHVSQEELAREVRRILAKYVDLSVYTPFFFGSRVSGHDFERSDIDIGVEGPEPIPPEVRLEIEEELERLPVLYKIDFVDFSAVSERVKKGALESIEPISEAE